MMWVKAQKRLLWWAVNGNAANQIQKITSATYPGSWRMLGGGSGSSSRGRDVQLVATGSRGYFQILCSVDLVFTCGTFQRLQNVAVVLKHNNSPGTWESRVRRGFQELVYTRVTPSLIMMEYEKAKH